MDDLPRLPRRLRGCVILLLAAMAGSPLAADDGPAAPGMPTVEELARDNNLFLRLAREGLKWDEPAEPLKIAGPLYFVGTEGLGSWLFATSEGLILLNTAMPETAELIAASIRKLGFDPADIRIIINGHAHSDHAGAIAYFKELSGAELAVMEPDVAPMEDGGKSDFHYGADWRIMGFPPAKVDRVLRDGDTVRLGEVILTGYNTPGHTRGSTTWVTQVVDDGKAYVWCFPTAAASTRAIGSPASRRPIRESPGTTAGRTTSGRCSSRTSGSATTTSISTSRARVAGPPPKVSPPGSIPRATAVSSPARSRRSRTR